MAVPDHVVGIGASAGGVEALMDLVSRFRPSTAAFVIVTHLLPNVRSRLADVLQRSTIVPVRTIKETTLLVRNTIHVLPSGSDVTIVGTLLRLVQQSEGRPRWTINRFLFDLAKDRGRNAIGVVLSGTGMDGADGLAAIRANAGSTFCQTPDSARFSEMPRHALVHADFALTPMEIGDQLMQRLAPP